MQYPQSVVSSSSFVDPAWDVPALNYLPVVYDSNKLKDWADPPADVYGRSAALRSLTA